jgi:hypothetical protein
VLLVVALAVVAGLGWWRGGVGPFPGREACTAAAMLPGTRSPSTVRLSVEQAGNAATIAAVAVRRGLPPRAVTIALATAYQESGLVNLPGGDRDSRGLFQQRPSQGWGTAEQVVDPVYAAGRFYDALVRIDGYGRLEVTDAAQRVQRSAYGRAYADHEGDAGVLSSALTGQSRAALTCTVRPDAVRVEAEDQAGLTPRARRVLTQVRSAFGRVPYGGFAPPGGDTGRRPGGGHADGLAVDLFFRPVGNAAQRARGWAVAHWLVTHADTYDIATVIFDDRIWTARRSAEGWRPYRYPASTGAPDNPVLRHLDHVHVDVPRGS